MTTAATDATRWNVLDLNIFLDYRPDLVPWRALGGIELSASFPKRRRAASVVISDGRNRAFLQTRRFMLQ